MNLRALYLTAIANGLKSDPEEVLLGGFDEERRADTVHARRGEAYAFAYGVFRDFPGNPIRGKEAVWDCVLRFLDRVVEWMDEHGNWRWYLPATKKTHRINYPGSVFLWLRLLHDFGTHIPADRRRKIEQMFAVTLSARHEAAKRYLVDITDRPTSFNLFIKWMLELWYGGGILSNQDWRATGATAVDKMVGLQFDEGYWPDSRVHRGPVSNYNLVTLNSVATYARLSGDEKARRAVCRAADFHFHLSYPDGSSVETIDERNRHTRSRVNPKLLWCLAPFEETRAYAAYFVERLLETSNMAPAELDVGGVASLCDSLDAVPDADVVPAAGGDFQREFRTIPALAVRRAPWYVCLSGATTDVPGGMFHHDLQNHLSVWHDAAGLVLGGGNSLHDPPFSTFRFGPLYLAGDGRVETGDARAVLHLTYQQIRARVEVAFEDERTIRIRASTQGDLPPDSEFAIHVPGRFGRTLHTAHGEAPMDDRSIYQGCGGPEGPFKVGPLRFESPGLWLIAWPLTPVNIYNLPLRLPVESAVMRVATRVHGEPVEMRIRVEP